jgi:hypothetical protein
LIKEAIDRILGLAPPNFHPVGELEYADKNLVLICPPSPKAVECSTLQGLVDLYNGDLDKAKTSGDLLVHITSPTEVELISRESDVHGRRRVWARAGYPKDCVPFNFGSWMNPESFIISAQASFQRVKIETDLGTYARDLDYVLSIASKISADQTAENEDDGIAQRVAVKSGVTLKAEQVLRPLVNLAPYRTFAEIDQVLSRFVFRARVGGESVHLALFEGDGGRWRLDAVAELKRWLGGKFGTTPIVS